MPKFEAEEYRSVEEYRDAGQTLHGLCRLLLLAFAKHTCSKKDVIIRNFVARTDTMVRGVMQLWEISDFQDCWILNRCLLDRLFHLIDLDERNEFELFDDWSFIQQYHAQNRIRSDPEFRGAVQSQVFTPSSDEKARFTELLKSPPDWERPRAEAVAKRMNLRFLYNYGYDFGSTHVHPMANDGLHDFLSITQLGPASNFPDQRSVLSNTILVGSMIVQEGLNRSSFQWRTVVYDLFDHLRSHLNDGSLHYRDTFLKVVEMARTTNLCQRSISRPEGAT